MDIPRLLQSKSRLVEGALKRYLPLKPPVPRHLTQAMRYSIFAGGKRVRPFLVLEAARLCGGKEKRALPLACSVEMIHTYSLIHDDLPSMDDDDTRRGKPSCHRRFDEATAILAGDGLLSLAFDVLGREKSVPQGRLGPVVRELADAIGPRGMVGGQAADMRAQGRTRNLGVMDRVNGLKTGRLITACLECGALWAGGSPTQVRRLAAYGKSIGFLFQVVDDIIDGDGYARLAGREAARRRAARLRDSAKNQLQYFGRRGETLASFADFLFERKS